MAPGYERELDSHGVGYNWSLFQTGPGSSSEPTEFNGQLQVNIDESWASPINYEIESSENLDIDRYMNENGGSGASDDLELLFEFRFSLSGSRDKETIQLQLEGENGNSQDLHVKIPGQTAYNLAVNLVNQNASQEYIYEFGEYTNSELDNIFSFIESSAWIFDIHDVFRLMGTVSMEYGHIKQEFNESACNTFRNLIAKDGLGRFVSVHDLGDFRESISTYNSQDGLVECSFNEFLVDTVENHIVEAEEGGIEWYLGQIANAESLADELADNEIATLLSAAVQLEGSGSLREKYQQQEASYVEWEDYNEKIDKIKNVGDYETRSHKFRQVLASAARFGGDEFDFVLSNFLYWQSKSLRYDESDNRSQIQQLLTATQQIAENTAFTHLEKMAKYDKQILEGDHHLYDSPSDAIGHYEKAVRIAGGSGDDWEGSRYHHLVPALKKQTLAEAEEHKRSNDFKEGMDLIEDRLSLVEGLENVDGEQKDSSIALLRGVRNEIEGSLHLENQRHEQALELLNNAAGQYKRADHEGLFKGIIGRRLQIQALLAEVEGEFEKAASRHEDYVSELPDSRGARFHRGRQYVCRAKSKLLDGEYEGASQYIDEIEESESHLMGDERRFQLLIQTAIGYENNSVSDFSRILDTITQVDDNSAQPIDFSDNYATGYLTILAAQRLKSLPVENELLDELVMLSLEEACLPNTAADMSRELPQVDRSLEQVSVKTSWQIKLPTHVTNQLNQVRTDRQTTFGDHSSLVRDLIIPLEQQLAIIAEYHGHNYWGSQWADQLDTDRPFAIGDYFQFFDTEASKQLEAYDTIQDEIDTAVVGSQPVTQLRNALNHGRNPQVSKNGDEVISESQFENIYQDVTTLMEALSYDTPVIGEVETSFGESAYRVRLHWGRVLKRTWISCDMDLDDGEMYYLPPSQIGEEMSSLDASDVIPCEEERATSFLLDSN